VRRAGAGAGVAELATFGLRTSDFFRISGFGFRALAMSLFHSKERGTASSWHLRAADLNSFQAEHVLHVVDARLLFYDPLSGAQRPVGESFAARGLVR
jgi:hypothetical protein